MSRMAANSGNSPHPPTTAADSPSADIAAHLAELIQSINRLRAYATSATAGSAGDGLLEHLLLRVLSNGPMRASKLAETTQADPSTVSRRVATLVSRGLLERRADPRDGRAALLHLTPAGQALRADQLA